MSQPIADKAEVSIDFPDKFYHGSFGHSSRFDVKADEYGAEISLDRAGKEKRHVTFHLHYYLLADIIAALGPALAHARMTEQERARLIAAARDLDDALSKPAPARRR